LQFTLHVGAPALERGLGYPFYAPIGVFMPGCDPVMPDFLFITIAHAGIIRERRVYGVPDLIVEILSPGSREYDLTVKLRAYADAGVPEFVIIDPTARTLALYNLIAVGAYAEPKIYSEADTVMFACLPEIALRVGLLFEGAPDTEA
jgi:Uma2 family endonuclease